MKNIKITRLNSSNDNPEEFIEKIVNLTFSKKLNSSTNIGPIFLNKSTKELKELKNKIIFFQEKYNNNNLLSENQYLDFLDIELLLNTVIVSHDSEKIKDIICRVHKLENELNINIISDKTMLKNIIEMKHTSLLEHVTCTYLIEGASRSFLAQITRHRLFSFISASQHYIDYSTFGDFVIPLEIEQEGPDFIKKYLEANKQSLLMYQKLIADGNKPEVARQVLPNSMRNNLIVTGNLREWMNFMNQRLCNRNTSEIQYVAYLIKKDLQTYVPTISNYMGPDCLYGKCTQKHLSCNEKYSDDKLEEKYKVLKYENKNNKV